LKNNLSSEKNHCLLGKVITVILAVMILFYPILPCEIANFKKIS